MKTIRTECDNQLAASLLVEKRKATKHIEELNAEHKETVNKLRKKQYYLTKKNKDLTESMSRGNLSTFINKVLKGMHFENRASLVLDLVFTGEISGEAGKVAGKHFVCHQVKKKR